MDISYLARLLDGAPRNVTLTDNSLVVLSIKVGGVSNTELTKTILDKLILVQTAADANGTFDSRYIKITDLASTANAKGASLVGIEDAGSKFTATTVEAALAELADSIGSGAADDISYDNGTSGLSATNVQSAIDETVVRIEATETVANAAIPATQKGANNGVATLDGGGKIPVGQLPNSVMELQGFWDADTNTPTLTNGSGNPGDVWEVDVAGTTDFGDGDITFAIGDWAVYAADGKYHKSLNSNSVTSVNGQTGTVVLDTDDIAEGGTNKYFSIAAAKAAAVADAIVNGVTDVAPSQNAVFDALANKQDHSANLDEADTFFGATDLTGAEAEQLSSGANADSLHTHGVMVKDMLANGSMTAQTTGAVRLAVNGETARRAVVADNDTNVGENFYVIGLVTPPGSISAGGAIKVTTQGTHLLGTSDTPFDAADIGKPVFLDADGALTLTAPNVPGSGLAVVRIGIIEDTDRVHVDVQVVGVQ